MSKEAEVVQGNTNITRIFKGSMFAIVITLILLFIYSLVLTFTNLSEKTINVYTIIITCISILIGSSISAKKIKKSGIINGGLVGLIYVLFIYVFSSILQTGFVLNISSMIITICGIVAGMIRRNYRSKPKINGGKSPNGTGTFEEILSNFLKSACPIWGFSSCFFYCFNIKSRRRIIH